MSASGSFDFQFTLYTAPTGGDELGSILSEDLVLTDGLFRVELDFGPAMLNGQESWLEVAVRPSGSPEPYTVLTPTPYAIFAQQGPWSVIGVPVGFAGCGEVKSSESSKDSVTPETGSQAALAPLALTPNVIPKTVTGGVFPTFTDSQIFDDGFRVCSLMAMRLMGSPGSF